MCMIFFFFVGERKYRVLVMSRRKAVRQTCVSLNGNDDDEMVVEHLRISHLCPSLSLSFKSPWWLVLCVYVFFIFAPLLILM